ncbi:MAG: hypothetical protein CMJ83_09135 [Planctomycetes bacterium]|nr:hypothetical protein [Planctomycetota bacterium]
MKNLMRKLAAVGLALLGSYLLLTGGVLISLDDGFIFKNTAEGGTLFIIVGLGLLVSAVGLFKTPRRPEDVDGAPARDQVAEDRRR